MQTVIGLFENAADAQKAAQQLISNGFSSDEVEVSLKNNNTSTGDYTSANSSDDYVMPSVPDSVTGMGSQLGTAGTMPTSANWSNDEDMATRKSTNYSDHSDDDSFGGKVSKFFKNLFGSDDDEANRYSHIANSTGCVVTVYADSKEEAERAADILDENGSIDVNNRAAEYGYSGGSSTGYTTPVSGAADYDADQTLNVIKEDVQIGKREVETGGVRIRSRIVERPVEEKIRLREEKVSVERTPVDRPATTKDFQNFKEGEIEMTEYAEVADVTKQARVVEEVKLSKEVNERTETIRETAQDTEVDVEHLSDSDLTDRSGKQRNL